MKNVIDILTKRFGNIVKDAKVSEAFVYGNEFYITSEYDISFNDIEVMEKFVLSEIA